MKELVGKLSALDPEASEALKVVSFFDALTTNRVGLYGLLRGAAVLSGVMAGAERAGQVSRFAPGGQRQPDGEAHVRPLTRSFGGGVVWLERTGAPHANDVMILERLAFAVELLDMRNDGQGGLAVIIDSSRPIDERVAALSRLRVSPDARVRLIATDAGTADVGTMTTVMPTRYGMLQATLDVDGTADPSPPAGLGIWTRADRAPESWESAVVAHRLHTSITPVIDAEGLGAMLLLVKAFDPVESHPDVLALQKLDDRTAEILRMLVETESLRGAAAALAMHHSTLQAKHESVTAQLGYDPRSTGGRMRYIAAEILRRLSDTP